MVVKYFPVKGDLIDQKVTGDWGAPLEETRKKTEQLTQEVLAALQEGSRYHGYKDERAKPSLAYRVVKTFEFLEPLPTVAHSGEGAPMTDYNKIMERIGITAVGRTEGRQGSVALGLPRWRCRAVGIQHGWPVRRHQQQ